MERISHEEFRAATAVQANLRKDITREGLHEQLRTLRWVMRAQDVALTLADPDPHTADAATIWFERTPPSVIRSLIESSHEGHPIARAFRECGIPTGRLSDLPEPVRSAVTKSTSHQACVEITGLKHLLVARLLAGPQELGRVAFFRSSDEQEFAENRRHLLHQLSADLSHAARSLLDTHAAHVSQGEVAIVDSRGRIIYQTPSFRFLWGAISSGKASGTKLDFHALLTAPCALHTQIAYRIMSLGLGPESPIASTYAVRVPYSTGGGELIAVLSTVSGELYAYKERLLRIALRRSDEEEEIGQHAHTGV